MDEKTRPSTLFTDEQLFVEYVDTKNMPLGIIPLTDAMRQKQHFRLATCILKDNKGNIFLHKRTTVALPHQNQWDLFTTPVLASEAYSDAALRQIKNDLGITCEEPQTIFCEQRHAVYPTWTALLITTVPSTIHANSLLVGHSAMLLVDKDELTGIIADMPEFITPELAWAAATYILAPPDRKKK